MEGEGTSRTGTEIRDPEVCKSNVSHRSPTLVTSFIPLRLRKEEKKEKVEKEGEM